MRSITHPFSAYITYLFVLWFGVGCTTEDVCNSDPLAISIVSVQDGDCLNETGSIEVAANGGAGEYRYELDFGQENSTGLFRRVSVGDHIIEATDANGCKATLVVNVPSNVTFQDVRTIIRNSCAIATCHDGNRNLVDFTIDAEIKTFAIDIQSRTSDRSMPPPSVAPPLTEDQIFLIDCWVRDGAPE